jgi:hypothetical protein
MTVNFTIAAQIIGILLQMFNGVNLAQLSPDWQHGVTGIITILQAAQALCAHYYTPTGIRITPGASVTTTEGGTEPAHNK